MTFGEKLQKLRRREGLSQDALAELLEVSRQAVSRWERDETMPETEKVVRISEVFHVTADYLLKDIPEPSAEENAPGSREQFLLKGGYLLGWIPVAWGAADLLRMAQSMLILSGVLTGASVPLGGIPQMAALNYLSWLMKALLKIVPGVMAQYYGRKYVRQYKEEHKNE